MSLLCAAVFVLAAAAVGWLRARATRGDDQGLRRTGGAVDRTIDCDPCVGEIEWTGTWFLPRGGPYIFALESLGDSTSTLELDGLPVLRAGAVLSKERRVLPAGAHAVRVRHQGSGPMRLYWLPPGRRGDPEYVPPAALRPLPPAQAGPMPADLAFRADAAALTAWLVLAAGLCAFLLRERLRACKPARADVIAVVLLLAVALALRLWKLGAFGQTWDEDVYWSSGRNYLENFIHLDFRPRMWRWNFEHPPIAKYILGLGALWHDGYGPARALSALLGALTCALIYGIGRELFSRTVGAGAALLYAFLPPALAHSQIAGLETPSTFFTTLGFYFYARRRFLSAGVAGGLAAGCRFIAALVFVSYALAAISSRPRSRREWVALASSPAIGLFTLYALWPRLWLEGPVAGLRASLSKLNVQHMPEWFLGASILTPVPKLYFPLYFVACVTPALLLGLALSCWRRERATLVCLAFFLAPFLLAFSPVVQNGVRYLVPALPAAALLAAAGLDAAATRLHLRSVAWLLACAAAGLVSCLAIAPYGLDYYNFLVGGPRAAFARKRFTVGWWGEGIGPAVAWFNGHAEAGATVFYDLFPSHVVWLRDDVRPVRSPAEAQYVLLNHFQYRTPPSGFHELYRTQVTEGAPLAAVYARDPPQ
ncbi:MAG TPA: glycosyltransferase family 39 protein [Polyangia bacterium]|nr:glycosyltransferase family 39 protein [Polyangia bacterium]